jgi:hypothetical protein
MSPFLKPFSRRRAVSLAVAVLAVSTGLGVVGVTGSPAAASTETASPCVPYQVPALPGDGHGELVTMNSAGMYIGGVRDGSGAHAAWWTHAGSDLSTGWSLHVPDIPGIRTEFLDVNASGVMTGASYDDGYGFVYDSHSGELHWLPDFAGGYGDYPRRINASGIISGEAIDASDDSYAAIWRPPYTQGERVHAPGESRDFTLSDGTHVKNGSATYGINDEGTVAGYTFLGGPVHDVPQYTHAKEWHDVYAPLIQAFAKSADGDVTRLPAGYDQALGFAINNDGLVVGASMRDATRNMVPAYWRDGVAHDMGAPADTEFGVAYNVSQGGWATGGLYLPDAERSFVWTGAGTMRLNEPLPGYDNSWSHGVSDASRQVIGSSYDGGGPGVPTLWQCPTDFTTG